MLLIFNVFPYHVSRHFVSHAPDEIPVAPYGTRPHGFFHFPKLLECLPGRYALHDLYHFSRRIPGWCLNKQVYMVFHDFHRIYPELVFVSDFPKHLLQILRDITPQYLRPVLRHPHEMILQIVDSVPGPSDTHALFIQERPIPPQTPLPRLSASRFPPASKLAGIQRSSL